MPKRVWRVNIEISNICNLQCTFCPEVIRPKRLMDPEFFGRILDQVRPYTKVVTLHLMGDPLVHPKLDAFIERCAQRDLQIYFVTNGLILRERQAEWLLHPAIRQVSFSLHSFYDNFPDQDPSAYLDRIFRFTERAFAERPTLFLNYRLWNLESSRGTSQKNRDILQRIEQHFGVTLPPVDIRKDKKVPIQDYLSLHFDEEFTWPSLGLPVLHDQGTCHALTSHFGIMVDGTVVPCCLDKEGDIALGNLQTTALAEILKSERATRLKEGFRKGELREELCRRCQYIERFIPAPTD